MKKEKNKKQNRGIAFYYLFSIFVIINIFIFCSFIEMYNLSKSRKEIIRLNNEIEEINKINAEIEEITDNYNVKSNEKDKLNEKINTLDVEIKEISYKIDTMKGILEK